jgi:hypothetical protein
MDEKQLLPLLGAIPGILTPVFAWLQTRSHEAQERRQAERVLKRLEVVDKLLKITRDNGVPDHLREVQAKLLEEVVIVSQDYLASRKTKALVPRQQPRLLLRRLLLLYFPQSLKGWLVHVPFYMLIGVFSLLWSLTIFRMFQGEYNWPMLPNLVGLNSDSSSLYCGFSD